MTAASKSGMSEELTEHHERIGGLNRDVGRLEGQVRYLWWGIGFSIFMALALTYANFRAIQDVQDQSHIHPKE